MAHVDKWFMDTWKKKSTYYAVIGYVAYILYILGQFGK